MERTRFLVACAAAIAAAIGVITLSFLILNKQPSRQDATNIVVSGEMVCLPHKMTTGPQTQECALGLHTDDNRYYALKNATQTNSVGTRVTVQGALTTDNNTIYDIVGVIDVSSLKKP